MSSATVSGAIYGSGDYPSHILTDYYQPGIRDVLNNTTVFWSMIEANDTDMSPDGKFWVNVYHNGRSIGHNAMNLEGRLPDPGSQGYEHGSQRTVDTAGRIMISLKLMNKSSKDPVSFANAVDEEQNRIITDLVVDRQRQIWNDGSGRMAEIATLPGSGVVTLSLPGGIVDAAGCLTDETKDFFPGLRVAAVNDDGTFRAPGFVLSVDSATQITVAATDGGSAADPTNWATGDWIVKCSSVDADTIDDTAFRREIMGIEGIFSAAGVLDGNGLSTGVGLTTGKEDYTGVDTAAAGFQGILATSVNPWNQGISVDVETIPLVASETNLEDGDMRESALQYGISLAEKTNNADMQFILSSYETYDQYIPLLTTNKRYVNTIELKGGHKVLDFNGMPWLKDKDAWRNRAYILDPKQLTKKMPDPLEWLAKDGSVWSRVPDRAKYEAAFAESCNLVCDVRNRVGVLLYNFDD